MLWLQHAIVFLLPTVAEQFVPSGGVAAYESLRDFFCS